MPIYYTIVKGASTDGLEKVSILTIFLSGLYTNIGRFWSSVVTESSTLYRIRAIQPGRHALASHLRMAGMTDHTRKYTETSSKSVKALGSPPPKQAPCWPVSTANNQPLALSPCISTGFT